MRKTRAVRNIYTSEKSLGLACVFGVCANKTVEAYAFYAGSARAYSTIYTNTCLMGQWRLLRLDSFAAGVQRQAFGHSRRLDLRQIDSAGRVGERLLILGHHGVLHTSRSLGADLADGQTTAGPVDVRLDRWHRHWVPIYIPGTYNHIVYTVVFC